MNKGRGNVNDDIVMAMVCEKMGWTYQQYLDQPTEFIKLLMLKFGIDAEHKDRLTKKARHK